ncbi:MAG: hypothetical protein ABII12_11595 [Planctomycetota bacterium]
MMGATGGLSASALDKSEALLHWRASRQWHTWAALAHAADVKC